MYEALYRKYRPSTFNEVVGQEHITETLKMQVRTNRLSHAYLFIGTRGSGKTTCARILAKAVNCEHPVDGNPCNACRFCRGIDEGSILDVTELDAASNNGVDDVRMLRDEAVFSPTVTRKRVYIIDEVHMLSKPAFNALLKILEEPPEHLMFILATTELNKILPTILSRCQRHSFRRLDAEVIAKRLMWVAQQEEIELREDAARLLGRLAEGGMRDGLSLLDQCASRKTVDTETVLSAMGLAGSYLTAQLAGHLAAKDTAAALRQFQALWQEGKEPATLLGELAGLYRDALILRLAPHSGESLLSGLYGQEAFEGLSLSPAELLCSLNVIEKYLAGMRDTPSPRLQCELCLVELCGLAPADAAFVAPGSVPGAAEIPAAPLPKAKPAPATSAVPGESAAAPAFPPAAAAMPTPSEEPAAAPIPRAEIKTAISTGAAPASALSWKALLAKLREGVDIGTYNMLSDDSQVSGRWEDGALVLEVRTAFHLNMLSRPELLGKLRSCCGCPVRVEERKAPAAVNDDKLSALERFNNVTIN